MYAVHWKKKKLEVKKCVGKRGAAKTILFSCYTIYVDPISNIVRYLSSKTSGNCLHLLSQLIHHHSQKIVTDVLVDLALKQYTRILHQLLKYIYDIRL